MKNGCLFMKEYGFPRQGPGALPRNDTIKCSYTPQCFCDNPIFNSDAGGFASHRPEEVQDVHVLGQLAAVCAAPAFGQMLAVVGRV